MSTNHTFLELISLKINKNLKLFIIAILVCLSLILVTWKVDAAASDYTVRYYVDGEQKVVASKAQTVEQFLDQQNVVLFSTDAVEPERTTVINSSTFNINVYRSRPVTIIDGDQRQSVVTAAQSPVTIAKEAGVKLNDRDTAELERITDPVSEGNFGLVLKIARAKQIELNLYGKGSKLYTQATTVKELFAERKVKFDKDDEITPALNTKLKTGMKVALVSISKSKETQTEVVNYSTRQISDNDQEEGYSKVNTAGENGSAEVVYEIVKKNGKVVSRTEVSRVITKEPKVEVIVIGTKPKVVEVAAPLSGDCGSWIAAAGVTDVYNAMILINRESGCNPYAVNAYSGACGIPQALPCSKLGTNDPVQQIIWMQNYVFGRYGSWAAAVQHSNVNGWY